MAYPVPVFEGSASHATNVDVPFGIVKDGDYVYVTLSAGARFTVIDVSDPTSPTIAASITDALFSTALAGLCKKGDYVYVCARVNDRIVVIDVSTPTSPTVVGSVTSSTDLDLPVAVVADPTRDYLYVIPSNSSVAARKIATLDVSTPTAPTVAATTAHTANFIGGTWSNCAYDETTDYLYVPLQGSGRVYVIDCSNPLALATVANWTPTGDNTNACVIDGDYLYLAEGDFTSGDNGLTIWDKSAVGVGTPPTLVGTYRDSGLNQAQDVQVSGDYAYLTGSGRIAVIDRTDLANPTWIGGVLNPTTRATGWGFVIDGDHAYTTNRSLDAIDVWSGIRATGWTVGSIAF